MNIISLKKKKIKFFIQFWMACTFLPEQWVFTAGILRAEVSWGCCNLEQVPQLISPPVWSLQSGVEAVSVTVLWWIISFWCLWWSIMWGPRLDFHTSFKTKDVHREKQNIIHLWVPSVDLASLCLFSNHEVIQTFFFLKIYIFWDRLHEEMA